MAAREELFMLQAINVVGVVALAAGFGLGLISLLAMAFDPSSDVTMISGTVAIGLCVAGTLALLVSG